MAELMEHRILLIPLPSNIDRSLIALGVLTVLHMSIMVVCIHNEIGRQVQYKKRPDNYFILFISDAGPQLVASTVLLVVAFLHTRMTTFMEFLESSLLKQIQNEDVKIDIRLLREEAIHYAAEAQDQDHFYVRAEEFQAQMYSVPADACNPRERCAEEGGNGSV